MVNREAVSVLTRGTLIEPEMLASKPEASYLLASEPRESPACQDLSDGAPQPSCFPPPALCCSRTPVPPLSCHPLRPVMEGPNEGDAKLPVRIGFAVADCPTGEVVIGQWCDDDMRSRLRMYLTGEASGGWEEGQVACRTRKGKERARAHGIRPHGLGLLSLRLAALLRL